MTAIPTQDHWIEHPQGRLFVRRWIAGGRGGRPASAPRAPIVMLHDSLGSVELWRGFPADLAHQSGRDVLAYDRLGFGQSDARPARPSLDFVAEEARLYFPALREQFGLERFVAMGHSVGGGMAIHIAAEAGAACEALVTVAAQTFAEDLTLRNIAVARGQFEDPSQVQRLAKYHGDKARWVIDAWTGNWLDPGFAAWNLQAVLPRVRCPVLAIHGEHDEYGTRVHPEMIGRLAGGPSRVEILPGLAHVPHREEPHRIAALIAGFLDALPPA